MFKFTVFLSVWTTFGLVLAPAVAAADRAGDVVEVSTQLTAETIESGLFPQSSNASDCEEAAKAGFTCGQIVPRKTFSLPAGVSFAVNSSQLTEAARKVLAQFGPVLRRNETSGSKVVFVGHTDITGSPQLNMRLSKQRANAVREYFLQNFGIAPSFLVAEGVGSAQLKNKADPASAENRRVEITAKPGQ
jgi:OOP family OmpA-OmpF porin